MSVFDDVLSAVLNPNNIGRNLVKRTGGKVVLAFLVIFVLYSVILGVAFNKSSSKFVDVFIDTAKPDMPSFTIIDGVLDLQSRSPFIYTHTDLYELIKSSLRNFNDKHVDSAVGEKGIDVFLEGRNGTSAPEETFCLVIDETDGYKEKVDLDNFNNYVIIGKDTIERVDREENLPGNEQPLKDVVKEDIQITPDALEMIKIPAKKMVFNIVLFFTLFYTFIAMIVKIFLSALIVFVVMLIIRKKVPYDIIVKAAVYSLGIVIILALVHRFVILNGWILQGVYFVYLFLACFAYYKANSNKDNIEQKEPLSE